MANSFQKGLAPTPAAKEAHLTPQPLIESINVNATSVYSWLDALTYKVELLEGKS